MAIYCLRSDNKKHTKPTWIYVLYIPMLPLKYLFFLSVSPFSLFPLPFNSFHVILQHCLKRDKLWTPEPNGASTHFEITSSTLPPPVITHRISGITPPPENSPQVIMLIILSVFLTLIDSSSFFQFVLMSLYT